MKKITKDLIRLLESGEGVEDIIDDLRDVELSGSILAEFTTNEMIDALDNRCELSEAFNAYIQRSGATGILTLLFNKANKLERIKFLSTLLRVPYLATEQEYAEALKNYLR